MVVRVDVRPELLDWAVERTGDRAAQLIEKHPQIEQWKSGAKAPTLKQLETFAKAAHVPIGFLLLDEPPVETVPIPDYRTMGGKALERPSPDLLDTIYICQQRQEWYHNHAVALHEDPLRFVGSASIRDDVTRTAATMRHALHFDLEQRRQFPTWTEALRSFVEQADALGVLVMTNGVVGCNSSRKLDPEEFRGFALSDPYAPLVFINGADTKSARMFTLAHELAHIWTGTTALSDSDPSTTPSQKTERWCNQIAAELLAPLELVREEFQEGEDLQQEVGRLASRFKVSTLVVLRRIHDCGGLTDDDYWEAYHTELERLLAIKRGSGGDFYRSHTARVGKRFARALVASTLEGQTLHRDAFRLLGFAKQQTFYELGRKLGVL